MALSSGWLPRPLALPMVFLFLWVLFAAHVGAQDPPKTAGPNPVDHFCQRWWSQSVVKNNVLYIDSGVERFNDTRSNDSGDVYNGISNYILSISLTETWDWKKSANETEGLAINITRKNVTNPNTGTAVPNLIRGHLFHGPSNTTEIFNYGGAVYMYNQSFEGWVQPETSTYALWTYDPSADQPWDQHTVAQPWQPNHGAAAEDIEKGLGFYLGGQIDSGTSTRTLGPLKDNTQNLYVPLEGMLIINLVDSTSANISTSSMKRSTPRVGGSLDYIDSVGGSGILVALGGQIQPDLRIGEIANRTEGQLIDFSTVDVFDLEAYFDDPSSNGTWYEQATTGDIPPPRIDFCTVYVSAPDNSSHHIYLYGGVDPITGTSFDDVVILSLPSFTWTNVWPIGEAPRLGHNCHRAGKRQMITVGGNVTNLPCDWERKGVALLDLTDIEWGSVFRGEQDDYQVPRHVLDATNGTAEGRATVGEPRQGWTEEGLGEVFRKSRYTVPSTWVYAQPTGDAKTNVGAIAGGVVGGVVGLILIAGGLFLWHRRRVKARKPVELPNDDVPASRDGDGVEKKEKFELRGVNEDEPAELPGPDAAELNAPREFVEADRDTATRGAELPGTNVVAGGVHGVPIVRTPGDDLPESPEYTPGLKRPGSRRSRRSSASSGSAREVQHSAPVTRSARGTHQEETRDDYFTAEASQRTSKFEGHSRTPLEQTPPEEISPPETLPSPGAASPPSPPQDPQRAIGTAL